MPKRWIKALLFLGVVTSGLAHAQAVYTYTEKDGTVVYTNVPPPGSKGARKLKGSFHQAPRPKDRAVPRAKAKAQLEELEAHIEASAKRYKVPADLVRAVMHAESNFDTRALSHKGASGLMQLMPATAEDMYVKDIFDAKENIEGGTRYLRVLANQFDGDMVKMIAAYNAGPEAVRKYGGNIPPYEETQAYVRKVLALYFQYKELSQQRQAPQGGATGAAD